MTVVNAFDAQVLEVARAHGTAVAAEWSGFSHGMVLALRKRNGYSRGRGRPSLAELEAAKPSMSCPCQRCADWRAVGDERARREDAQERAHQVALASEILVGTTEEWRLSAACRDEPLELFFPERGDGARMAAARALCGRCSVRETCLDLAMRTQTGGAEVGVFGGLSARERRLLRRA